jgi:hypothetical protein
MYLPHAAKTLKAGSIGRRIAAIAHYYEQAGQPSTMAHPIVKNLWKGVRREIGIAQKGKSALRSTAYARSWPASAPAGSTSATRALLLGFGAALRRSEFVPLDVGDLAFVLEGASVLEALEKHIVFVDNVSEDTDRELAYA